MAGGDCKKKKGVINIGGPAAAALLDMRSMINSPKHHNQNALANTMNDSENNGENDVEEILITQEEEQQIKEVISDINHKAFYGKILKKTKEIDYGNDESLKNLSPRSREIATVMKIIKSCKFLLHYL